VIAGELEHPIVQAPLGGGPSTPALAVAVSDAGGLGFLAAGYRTAEAMRGEIAAVRELTRAPFGVNVFVPSAEEPDLARVHAYVDSLRADARRLGAEPGEPRRG
jgi:nitronate monooxygenase